MLSGQPAGPVIAHWLGQVPPQSTPVSVPFFMPSEQVGLAAALQFPLLKVVVVGNEPEHGAP